MLVGTLIELKAALGSSTIMLAATCRCGMTQVIRQAMGGRLCVGDTKNT